MPHTVWIFPDQLTRRNSALAAANRKEDVVLFVEPLSSGPFQGFHKKKTVLLFAAMRHFADGLREKGWTVDYHELGTVGTYEEALALHRKRHGRRDLLVMEPNDLPEDHLVRGLGATVLPTCQFVVPRTEFATFALGKKRLLMENHYRATRQRLGILVDPNGEPEGGRWNFDAENRKTVANWKADGAPRPPRFAKYPPDDITQNVIHAVEKAFPLAPGETADFAWPVTRTQAVEELRRFTDERLPRYGEYQDLMLEDSPGMFHSWISAPLNLGLLDPMECVDAAVTSYRTGRAPLAAVEGFVRQIIGWREFVNGVYWLKMPEYAERNELEAQRPLPGFFRSGETDMHCLRTVLVEVKRSSYNHHIQRLMVLGNFLLLAGIRPSEALRWFTDMYVDAFDWVMAANVLGMALHADGGFMATKPYAGSGAYISRMSNYCTGCRFDPAKKSGTGACPFNLLYWDFYDRHAARFARNPRTSMMVKSWSKRPEEERNRITREARAFLESL